MAQRPKKPDAQVLDGEEKKGDFEALLDSVQENPLLYGAFVAFILVCGLAGVVYRVHARDVEREVATEYLHALDAETPAEQAEALEALATGKSGLAAEALYMQGEAAYRADDREGAAAAFKRLRETFPDSPFTPDAVEGLGAIEEDRNSFDEALARYREVLDTWPGSFTAKRQPFNIGRCQERAGNHAEAVEAFRDQLDLFPGSTVAGHAQHKLDRLRVSHPGLFPEVAATADTQDHDHGEAAAVAYDAIPDVEISVEDEAPAAEETREPQPAE